VEPAATPDATAATHFSGLTRPVQNSAIAFWDYLGARLAVPGSPLIPALAEIVGAYADQHP